ncbi:MAG TPA: histidine kinase [Actinomycetes bacterium]|jgi:two-component system sensor histidine kinase UhpB|nr:histidine kinase [Actinomycetes bacterium]
MSLFWRVFATNAALLVAAAIVLGLSPITVSWPIALTEAVVLTLGLVAMLVANIVLLRPVFVPLERLADRMGDVDLLRPGQRFAVAARGEILALVEAFNQMLERLEAERRESGRRALAAQEAERKRVASELHDEVGQTMTAVLMSLVRLQDGVVPERRQQLADAQEAIRGSLEEVRRIAQELRPEMLEHLGLVSALTALARTFSARTGIQVRCRFARDLPALDAEVELVLYRIVQESLTNVARHAHAACASLSMEPGPGRVVVVRVVDDGRGVHGRFREGGGVRGMRERVMVVGGELVISTAPTGGVEVRVEVPGLDGSR